MFAIERSKHTLKKVKPGWLGIGAGGTGDWAGAGSTKHKKWGGQNIKKNLKSKSLALNPGLTVNQYVTQVRDILEQRTETFFLPRAMCRFVTPFVGHAK